MTVTLGTLEIAMRLEGCRSLKDKRRILRSVIDRIRRDCRAAVAEVDEHDLWGNATLGVAVVGADPRQVEQVLQRAQDIVEGNSAAVTVDVRREIGQA